MSVTTGDRVSETRVKEVLAAWPNQEAIAQDLGCSMQIVSAWIECGYIAEHWFGPLLASAKARRLRRVTPRTLASVRLKLPPRDAWVPQIDDDIPMPDPERRKAPPEQIKMRLPLATMREGQSVFVPLRIADRQRLDNRVHMFGWKHRVKFAMRHVIENGVPGTRIWHIGRLHD